MIFNRLAEKCGFTMDQVLDLTPHATRTCMADEASLRRADHSARENEIRDKLKDAKDKGKRLLVMKYEKELSEHLTKAAPEHKRLVDAVKARIREGIRRA